MESNLAKTDDFSYDVTIYLLSFTFIIFQVLVPLIVAIQNWTVMVIPFHCPRSVQLHRFESVALVRMEYHTISLASVGIA